VFVGFVGGEQQMTATRSRWRGPVDPSDPASHLER